MKVLENLEEKIKEKMLLFQPFGGSDYQKNNDVDNLLVQNKSYFLVFYRCYSNSFLCLKKSIRTNITLIQYTLKRYSTLKIPLVDDARSKM